MNASRLFEILNDRSYETFEVILDSKVQWNFQLPLTHDFLHQSWELRHELLPLAWNLQPRLNQELENLAKGGSPTLETESVIFDFRTLLKFVRSLLIVTTTKHQTPKKFQKLVRLLGQLRDDLKYNEGRRGAALSHALLPMTTSNNLKELFTKLDKLAIDPNTDQWLTAHLNPIRFHLSKDRVAIHDFHESRKKLEHLLALTESLYVLKHPGFDPNVYRQLYRLHRKLGKHHNKAIAHSCESALDYDQMTIEWPPKLRQELLNFLNF